MLKHMLTPNLCSSSELPLLQPVRGKYEIYFHKHLSWILLPIDIQRVGSSDESGGHSTSPDREAQLLLLEGAHEEAMGLLVLLSTRRLWWRAPSLVLGIALSSVWASS